MHKFSAIFFLAFAVFFLSRVVGWSQDFQNNINDDKYPDYSSIISQLVPLAEYGDSEAQYRLGLVYASIEPVPPVWRVRHQNQKESVKWYRLAAEQGHEEAQLNLGLMYGAGEGLVKNLVYAYMWMHISAFSGDARAIAGRKRVAKVMTQSQLDLALVLALECVKKEYKSC